ncbi:survival factor 1 [Capronia coronata CBS 617.96]|uniref:Survival factor 1 n=1 Tax=Capronia coronata CBS 617.96 TaxID=1182541 RepID=W9Y826_9EURO|nr:survival factor 1 [Capronia coronata CBS 617.96]EXJ78554.1 survival factor 1 [Capronia coronata CBS 617.96]
MNWFKQQLANVVGTEEPEYGPDAIQPVTKQMETKPYSILNKNDLKWKAMDSTNVETETFYLMLPDGTTLMLQVIYSNVGGIHTTAQFNSKIFDHDGPGKHLWCSDPLRDYGFDEPQTSFYAENLALELNEAGDTYTIKSAVNDNCIVNVTLTRTAPGFQLGNDGTSYFGTDPANPWGSLRHAFWPRCTVSGTVKTPSKEYDMTGRGLYVYALQGMKPHHLAVRWNFVNFQTPTYSAVLMEYTTPASYGKTVVSVGGIAKDNELVCVGPCTAKHVTAEPETEADWPEPKSVAFEWRGEHDGKPVKGEITGDLPVRSDRVDVLAHLPGFVKSFISGATGLRPHIFQYCSKDQLTLKLKIGDEEISEPGQIFTEATFIA